MNFIDARAKTVRFNQKAKLALLAKRLKAKLKRKHGQ